jgi:hypothetical protein
MEAMTWFARCFAVIIAVFVFSTSHVAAQAIDGLHGDAAEAIKAKVRSENLGDSVMAHVFYGDATGTGTKDAIAFLYHPSGGNSDVLTTWIWRDTANGYELTRAPSIEEVFGLDPRSVKFSPGRIEVTTTVMKPGDARCCPSGEQTFSLPVERVTETSAKNNLDVPILEAGGDGQMASCSSSTVYGLKSGGDGFLAIRSGPGTEYRKIGELYNGDVVFVFEARGKWAGVVYRTENVTCASTVSRPVPYENKGWVHTKWLKELAG